MEFKTIMNELSKPFKKDEIEWRIQSSGKTDKGFWAMVMPYVQNRAIMDRLDEVVGANNWQNVLREISGGFECGISIKADGEWVTKWDGADRTAIEPIKGGISNAMKRSAVQWGMGRYLYSLDIEFAETTTQKTKGYHKAKTNDGTFYWKTPELPAWALPDCKDTDIQKALRKFLVSKVKEQFSKSYGELTDIEKDSLIKILEGMK